uniref:Uncharacterized protein n=1 Tax=Cebus imitator TaxID=2715852 RepID=A0A2K5SI63_CEBIM
MEVTPLSLQIPGRKLPQIPPLGGGARPQARREQVRKQPRWGGFAARRHPRANSLSPARDVPGRPRLLIFPCVPERLARRGGVPATQPGLCRDTVPPSNCDLGAVTSECHPPLARPSAQPRP